jgi:hypothetical protein
MALDPLGRGQRHDWFLKRVQSLILMHGLYDEVNAQK